MSKRNDKNRTRRAVAALGGAAVVTGSLVALLQPVHGQGIGFERFQEMLTPTKQKIARGERLYDLHCASCHGQDGAGNGPLAQASAKLNPPSLIDGVHRYGGGVISIYNVISKASVPGHARANPGGLPPREDSEATPDEVGPQTTPAEAVIYQHPRFGYLPYQDRWAISHYVRSLNPGQLEDPAPVYETAKREAIEGVCDPAIEATVGGKVEPRGEEQIATGGELYVTYCTSCHGDEGRGDGPAAGGLTPPPRNFQAVDQKWTNGTSPLAIFNTLTTGIEDTSMASYSTLSEDERWALTHFVRQWIPQAKKQESTTIEIQQVCRALSQPPRPPSIPIEVAMKALVEDQPEQRLIRRALLPAPQIATGADVGNGQKLYVEYCGSCHGAEGVGNRGLGPYGSFPPYLYVEVGRLQPEDLGGDAPQFARRVLGGAHASLPNMTGVGILSRDDWSDLHGYLGSIRQVEPIQAAPLDPLPPIAPAAGGEGLPAAGGGAVLDDEGGPGPTEGGGVETQQEVNQRVREQQRQQRQQPGARQPEVAPQPGAEEGAQ